jgi:hypothetical protein
LTAGTIHFRSTLKGLFNLDPAEDTMNFVNPSFHGGQAFA